MPRITEALRLKHQPEREIREGTRTNRDWIAIAKDKIPNFDNAAFRRRTPCNAISVIGINSPARQR